MTAPEQAQDQAAVAAALDARTVDRLRYTGVPPMGTRGAITATNIAEVGAVLGAMGAEKNTLIGIMHRFQDIAVQAHVQALPEILDMFQELVAGIINRIMQEVQALPEVPVPNGGQGLLTRLTGVQAAGTVTQSYVNRESVNRILVAALNRRAGGGK